MKLVKQLGSSTFVFLHTPCIVTNGSTLVEKSFDNHKNCISAPHPNLRCNILLKLRKQTACLFRDGGMFAMFARDSYENVFNLFYWLLYCGVLRTTDCSNHFDNIIILESFSLGATYLHVFVFLKYVLQFRNLSFYWRICYKSFDSFVIVRLCSFVLVQ